MNILEVTNLSKTFKNSVVLKNITFHVKDGETLALVGQTGCGKTTLARCICGFTDFTSGKMKFNMVQNRSAIQYVFQNHGQALNPFFTIQQSISEVLRITRKIRKPENHFLQLMHDVGLDSSIFEKYPGELSSGQKQRVVIARALAADPRILVADEPTSNLDPVNEKNVLELFAKLKKNYGLTLIIISHDIKSVKQFADRIAVMFQGEIIEILDSCCMENIQHDYSKRLMNHKNSVVKKPKNSISLTNNKEKEILFIL